MNNEFGWGNRMENGFYEVVGTGQEYMDDEFYELMEPPSEGQPQENPPKT